MRQHEAAIAEFERAIVLNPNLNDFHFALALVLAGEPARAIQTLEAHMRLDPFYLPHTPGWLGFAYYMLERYADALPHLQECVSRAPNLAQSHHWLAATYAQLGQLDKARAEAAEGLRIEPWFTIGQALFARTCKRPEDAEHFKRRPAQGGVSGVIKCLPCEPMMRAPTSRGQRQLFSYRAHAGMTAMGHKQPERFAC